MGSPCAQQNFTRWNEAIPEGTFPKFAPLPLFVGAEEKIHGVSDKGKEDGVSCEAGRKVNDESVCQAVG
jgi:hypothetical protein